MEKRTPHYSLARMQTLIRQGHWRVTAQASKTGLKDFNVRGDDELRPWVLSLRSSEFYKSMTCIDNHRSWQDVYHATVRGRPAYVKLQITDDNTVVISFKSL